MFMKPGCLLAAGLAALGVACAVHAGDEFYVGLTRDLRSRRQAQNKGLIASTKTRIPRELVYWEG
jgi:predicted GIY-YIG superfamily endonuclease